MIVKENTKAGAKTISFLFEDSGFSVIMPDGKSGFSKNSFHMETLYTVNGWEKAKQVLEKQIFFQAKHEFIDISVLNNRFTLIPLEHFDEDTAEIFLNYNVPFSLNEGLRFNLIPQWDTALVFYYPEEIETLFENYSDKLRITHTGFKLLSNLSLHSNNGIYVNLYAKQAEFAVIQDSKLLLYNIFPCETMKDILYFLFLTCQKLSLSAENTDVFYLGRLEDKESGREQILRFFRSLYRGGKNEFEGRNFTTLDLL